jgi:hypothetical protein
MKGARDTKLIGFWISWRSKTSPAVPPATLKKLLPANPVKKRAMIIVSMFWATAEGMVQMMNMVHETR